MNVFLDTNILLDVLLDRPGLANDSANVIMSCEAGGKPMFIAWHGLATAYYLLRRGRSEVEALVEVDRILGWARVATINDAAARHARDLGFSDFEDALQASAAEACGAAVIVTRNTADFSKSMVPAMNPKDFLARFGDPRTI
jgi:predicted nucleic acid-binding protein